MPTPVLASERMLRVCAGSSYSKAAAGRPLPASAVRCAMRRTSTERGEARQASSGAEVPAMPLVPVREPMPLRSGAGVDYRCPAV